MDGTSYCEDGAGGMSELLRKIVQSRAGGKVERCHTHPHHGEYTNAAHQWGVAMLLYYLWPADFPRLVAICLSHDIPEAWVGDIPATTKRYVPGIRQQIGHLEDIISLDLDLPQESSLSDEDMIKFKACDQLELYFWALENNHPAMLEIANQLERFWEETPLPPIAQQLFAEIKDRGRCCCLVPKYTGVVEETLAKMENNSVRK